MPHYSRRTLFLLLAHWILLFPPHFVTPTPQRWVDTLPTFLDPNKSVHRLVVDHSTGDVFVGGRNVLYHLSADLKLKQSVKTGPLVDAPGCPIPPYPCSKIRGPTDNDARILELVYNLGDSPSLLLCGTVYRNLCQVRPLDNLEEFHWVHPYNETLGYATNRNFNFANYAIFERGFDGQLSFFSTTRDDGTQRQSDYSPYLSSRVLEKEGDRYSFRYSFQNDTISSFLAMKGINSRYAMDSVFVYDNFIYFPILYFINTTLVGSRLVRFCITDPTFQTYAELPIQCAFEDTVLKRLLAAHLGESPTSTGKALYVSFNEDNTGTALCIFEMSWIIESFATQSRNCNRDFVGETCDQKEKKEIVDFCGSDVSPYVVSQPLAVGAFAFITNVALVAVTTVKQYDDVVVIAGSNRGILVKYSTTSKRVINAKDMLEHNVTSPFVSPFVFDHQKKHIYLLVSHKVIKYPVASCNVHETCDTCFSRGKDDPLKCGWCAGRCAHLEECAEESSFSHDTCTPTIYKVFPQKGPIQGGNTITITGNTLGTYVNDDHNSILVAGIPCAVTFWNNTQVNCTLGPTPEVLSGPVQLNVINTLSSELGYGVAGSTFSQSNFSYYVGPRLYGVSPNKGPTSGGTIVSLFGQDLDFDKDQKRLISVRGRLCTLKRFDKYLVSCITGNTSSADFPSETIAIHINGVAYVLDKYPPSTFNVTGLSQSFEYTPDPYINHVRPGITTLSGLMNLTAIGRHLDSIQHPKLVVTVDQTQIIGESEYVENCWVYPKSNGTAMTCSTPNLKDKSLFPIPTRTHPFVVKVSFIMDHVQKLRDFAKRREDLSRLLYYPDPEFKVFQEPQKIKVDQRILEIKGMYLDLMHLADTLRVRIGEDEFCKITSVSSDVLFCDLPPSLFSDSSLSGTNLTVEVLTGSTTHHLGYIEFDQQKEGPWYIILVVVIIVVASGVAYLGYKWFVRRRKKPVHTADVALQNPYSAVPTREVTGGLGPEVAHVDNDTLALLENKDLIIQKSFLTMGDKIGAGQFGCVFEGYLQNSDRAETTKVAVKTLRDDSWRDPLTVQIFLREALLMRDFNHPNVLRLLGVCFEGSGPSIVLPFMENKDLHTFIADDKREGLFVIDLLKFAVDVTAGMSYLENARFIHRDLAARNCVLDSDWNARVADFGLSRDIYVDNYYCQQNKGKLPYKWTAPESLENRVFSTKSDVWACGVLLWELMTRGSIPYCNVDNFDLVKYIKRGYRLDQPQYCPLPLYKIMLACWNIEPNQRPSFHEIHYYVKCIRNELTSRQAEALPAAEAVPSKHTVYYNSEELYLSMEGHALNRNILREV